MQVRRRRTRCVGVGAPLDRPAQHAAHCAGAQPRRQTFSKRSTRQRERPAIENEFRAADSAGARAQRTSGTTQSFSSVSRSSASTTTITSAVQPAKDRSAALAGSAHTLWRMQSIDAAQIRQRRQRRAGKARAGDVAERRRLRETRSHCSPAARDRTRCALTGCSCSSICSSVISSLAAPRRIGPLGMARSSGIADRALWTRGAQRRAHARECTSHSSSAVVWKFETASHRRCAATTVASSARSAAVSAPRLRNFDTREAIEPGSEMHRGARASRSPPRAHRRHPSASSQHSG